GVPAAELNERIKTSHEVKQVEKDYGVGSAFWMAGSALTSLASGGLGGNLNGAISGAAAPYLAALVKDVSAGSEPARIALHTALGAVLAHTQGGSAAGGAAGGLVSAAGADVLTHLLYPEVKKGELSAEQKQLIANLVTIAGAGAGGFAGGNLAGAGSGANTAKNEVENNFFGKALVEGCAIAAPCRTKVAEKLLELGVKVGITGVVAKEIADNLSSEELEQLIRLNMMGNDEITVKYLNSLQDKYAPSHTGNNDGEIDLGLNHTGNYDGQVNTGPNHTGNNNGQVDAGSNHTGGDQSVEQVPNNTGNTEGAPDLPNHYESGNKITQGEHATIRNKEGRPVGSVINDVQNSRPSDILVQDDGRWVVLGPKGRVHIIEPNGEVVTSMQNPKQNTNNRLRDGRWEKLNNDKLQEFKDRFSDYVRW
ncbi:VENN motif pre-toxin domain-containing protein, partial [Pectobacterium versatile]